MIMPLTSEMIKALFGTLYLAKFNVEGFKYIPSTSESFFRSFVAALITLPFFLILITLRFDALEINVNGYRYLCLELCSYAISWLAFPLLMDHMSWQIKRETKFFKFIIAHNWSLVIQNVIYSITIFLGYIGILTDTLTRSLILLILMWTFAFTWFIAKNGLNVSVFTAISVVLVGFFLNLAIELTISSRY